jgi:hypothetical protein
MVAYSQIGKLWQDHDLRAQGLSIDRMPVIKERFVAPSLPYASLCLGRAIYRNGHDRGLPVFERKWTFTRELPLAVATGKKSQKRAASSTAVSTRGQPKKMKNVGDLFAQFSA